MPHVSDVMGIRCVQGQHLRANTLVGVTVIALLSYGQEFSSLSGL